ncbi:MULTISPECIES: IclR family transcriptional regulator [unclassified Mycolicibacterium]|uniref:IclR family transcriptional regulator n=1 Tax=unclassified Mycolicibacterium TaxID=2636767 RepID=UPI0012DD44E4|nr:MULTISPECIES: IclR family transcriptional regulator [unclassified Mycolicibacterium]MUL82242.1 IclR family transcriptional regulator [Mycolicibacterium sp. CBMA 329]MUL88008.1 IclR family transcriptional regulator [Mycolicibacterium sp. CBMA 331]MUM26349.1 IclR family transcriptional regulator [Mycolicibacterium sp. CBMA 295]MUM38305.1 IclR family transcriptional regulator [Mycolicibacterium sp. CBMA 247]MUM44073.1 IclR family transcriptional regulator [Mycolicibacterium sp. CBMA 294]
MAGDDASETITSSVRTLGRGLEILELFSGGDAELSQSDIAARAGLPMPTIHRLVKTLVAHEFLEPVAGGRNFRIGPAVLRLAGSLIARSDPAAIIRRKLQQLAETTGETTNLATLVGSSVVYLDGVAGGRILTPQVSVGLRLSAYNTALGKALLAQLDDDDVLARVGQGPYPRATENSAVDWPELKKRLDIVRADGIAVSDEEFEVGLASLAIALPTPVDRSLRAINISLPVSRATPDFRATAGRLLREVAAEIGSIEGSSAE